MQRFWGRNKPDETTGQKPTEQRGRRERRGQSWQGSGLSLSAANQSKDVFICFINSGCPRRFHLKKENGLIVPARDGGAIADAIIRLMEDEEVYRHLSNGALLRYEREFTSVAMTRRVEAVYETDLKK